jgi:hypothetical protein
MPGVIVQADAELLCEEVHWLVREGDETDEGTPPGVCCSGCC